MQNYIEIKGRRIGPGCPTYIVAEMSANHNRDLDRAIEIFKAAKEAGADAVKVQTYTPDTLTIDCDNEYFRIEGTPWQGRNLYDLYREAYTPWEWQPKLKAIADDLGLTFFSTAFDLSAITFLEEIGVPAYKVASFEIVDMQLIRNIARTGKPLIISTGMATIGEIEEAITVAREEGANQIAVLKCTSAYPAIPAEMNLRTIPNIMKTFHLPVGLSDHTLEIAVPVAAVALGACIVEKHITISREIPGPDSAFSLEPQEFKDMVDAVHTTEKALGEVCYGRANQESKNRVFRRSLFVVQDMKGGEVFTERNVSSIRPGYGLSVKFFGDVIGRCAVKDIQRGTPLDWSLIAG